MAATPRIDYYVALISPWSYLGGERFRALAAASGADVQILPVKLPVVYAETGGVPLPKRAPARVAYRLAELRRWRDHLGIPIVLEPKHFPADETLAAHLVITAGATDTRALPLAIAIGRALWERNQDIADPQVLEDACTSVGITMAALTEHPAFAAAAPRHEENTRRAIDRGVFGVPSYVFGEEIFWGQDRLDFLTRALDRARLGL